VPSVKVGSIDIQVGDSMRYLGVIVHSAWSFRNHFEYVENKIVKIIRALSRLMLNLRGPGERKRQLYVKVLTSVAMYAAPVWGRAFAGEGFASMASFTTHYRDSSNCSL